MTLISRGSMHVTFEKLFESLSTWNSHMSYNCGWRKQWHSVKINNKILLVVNHLIN